MMVQMNLTKKLEVEDSIKKLRKKDKKKAAITAAFVNVKINVWSIVDDDVLCVNQLFYVQRDVRHE